MKRMIRDWGRVETLCQEYGVEPETALNVLNGPALRSLPIKKLRRLLLSLANLAYREAPQ